MKRTLRDIIIMVIFCAAFYGITSAVNLMGKEQSPVDESSEYSPERQLADEALSKRSYLKAAKQFEKLIEADPHNGHAWFLQAESYNSARITYLRRVADARIRPYRTARIGEWQEEAVKYGKLAIPAYEKAVDFRRFRERSNVRLAAIYSSMGETETALKHLSTAVDQGYASRLSLIHI